MFPKQNHDWQECDEEINEYKKNVKWVTNMAWRLKWSGIGVIELFKVDFHNWEFFSFFDFGTVSRAILSYFISLQFSSFLFLLQWINHPANSHTTNPAHLSITINNIYYILSVCSTIPYNFINIVVKMQLITKNIKINSGFCFNK